MRSGLARRARLYLPAAAGRRLLLLATRRTDEPDPEHACARLAEAGEQVALARLTRADVAEIARSRGLDRPRPRPCTPRARGCRCSWPSCSPPAGLPTRRPRGCGEAVEARLDAVSETAAQVLSAAAVIGRTFDVDTVRAASGRSGDEVVAALDELCARGLIVERDAAYDFGHERVRAAVDERGGLARRRLLNGRVAEALDPAPGRSGTHRPPPGARGHERRGGRRVRGCG